MNASWINRARQMLLEQQIGHTGWGYRRGAAAQSEPTALAGLALLASAREGKVDDAVGQAADWLAGIQQADGSVGLSGEFVSPGWPTAYALLLWSAVDGYGGPCARAVDWLLGISGRTFERDAVTGHDPNIPGWPWVAGTHSWLEPTATAVIALGRQGLVANARVRDGIRLISNRATWAGGWNFGGVSVFNADLCPHPAPTGLALLALASLDEEAGVADRGCGYLLKVLPRVRSPRSLGWGLLGLDAWHRRPPAADAWLAESFARLVEADATAVDLADLLLAASPRSVKLFQESMREALR